MRKNQISIQEGEGRRGRRRKRMETERGTNLLRRVFCVALAFYKYDFKVKEKSILVPRGIIVIHGAET